MTLIDDLGINKNVLYDIISKKKDYISEFLNWKEVIEKRNYLISLFWNEKNKSDVKIDLVLNV